MAKSIRGPSSMFDLTTSEDSRSATWVATTWLGCQQRRTPLPWAQALFEAFCAGAWALYWTEDTLYWIAKPRVHVEIAGGQRRLHCETGPAVESDIEPLYFWHGVLVPAHAVIAPERITAAEIDAEANAEVRRVLIERYGWDRWLRDQGAQPVQADRYGDLYRTTVDGAEIGVVAVTNSTPEADGQRKRYALLVPATHGTAHAAVASTFGLPPWQYAPEVET